MRKQSERASDGFEHGFLGFDELFAHAETVRLTVAAYLRAEIVTELNLDHGDVASLTADQYSEPGHLLITEYLRGLLVGRGRNWRRRASTIRTSIGERRFEKWRQSHPTR
jgi:hypothetical protein